MKLSKLAARTLACTLALAPAAMATLVVASPAVARADAKGDKVLEAIDKKGEVFDDTSYTASMKIYRGGEVKKTLVFDMTMKGLEKQYIVFKSPGDVAGMKVLMDGPEDLWMYNTEFKKVRKIAAHAQAQGFFGSDFTAEDMVLAKLSNKFNGKVLGKKGSITTLELTPKPGAELSISKLEIDIDAKVGGVTVLRYYDSTGKVERTQTRGGWKKIGGHAMPTQITMKDAKTGNKTVINLADVKVNQGVKDDLFSRRTLLR